MLSHAVANFIDSNEAFSRYRVYFHSNERVAIVIDGANLHAANKALGIEIDYRRLLTFFRGKARVIGALYYTMLHEGQEYSSLRPLVDWLEYNGFSVFTKAFKEFVDANGNRRWKGSMNVEIAVDVMRLAPSIDHLVLFSGDGDFRYLVAAVQKIGKRVSVVSTLKTSPPMASDDLRREADQFIELGDLEKEIGRRHAAEAAASSLRRQAKT